MARRKTTKDLNTSILAGSDEIFYFFCQPCSPDKHVEAVGYCKDCSEYLCITCTDYHGKLSATKHHTVLDKSKMPKTKAPPKIKHTDILTEKCRKHPDKLLEYFCKTHDQICCSACVTLEHISCSDKSYVPDVSSGIAISQEYKNIKADFDRLLRQITKLQEHNKDSSKNNEKHHFEAIANIQELRRQVNDLLDKLEEDAKRNVANIHQNNTDVISRTSEKCQTLLSEVNSLEMDMDEAAKAGKNNQLFVQVKLSGDCIADIEKQIKEEECERKVTRYIFDRDEKMQQMRSTLSDIWSVSVRQDANPTKARYLRGVNMKTDADTEECLITGIAVLTTTRMVVTDYNNKAVKLYDMMVNKLLSRLALSSEPLDITKIKANQVAVALGEEAKLVIITVSDTLSTSQTIETPGANIFSLCYNGSNFITTCHYPFSVKIINMSGKTLNKFTTDDKGNQLFTRPLYITPSRDKDAVYVTDDKTNKVTSMTLSGRVVWVYTHDELKKPAGVAVDKDGTVYVCSNDTHTVHQLTPTGDLTRIILGCDQGLANKPTAIAYGEEDNILYISSYSREPKESNFIRLFQLE